jgi:hypothetical protein
MHRRFHRGITLLLPCVLALPSLAQPGAIHDHALTTWLQQHKAEDFKGQVWVRFRVDQPQDLLYNVIIDSETDPYNIVRVATGTMSAHGLQPKPWPETEKKSDWGKPLPWAPPADEAGWIKAGQTSPWAELPTSHAAQWHTAFFVRPKTEAMPKQVVLHLEFATAPADDAIFHRADEATDEAGAAMVRMPEKGGLEGLRMLETYTEWARRRRAIVESLKLSPPPRLTKLRVGTWAGLGGYRAGGGTVTRERAELDFKNFQDLGINSASVSGISDDLFRELAQKYGIIDTTHTVWAANWYYTPEGYSKKYDFQPNETPEQRWQRVFDDFFRKSAEHARNSYAASLATHLNLGDEIGAATNADEIRKTPQLLSYFHDWLRGQGLTPTMLGAADWDGVDPVDDRKLLNAPGATPEYTRRFYYTRRFCDAYTALFYRLATNAAEKYYPHARIIAVNYQAGPMQNGFIGNNNDMNRGELDIFEMGRQRALKGVMMEDWVYGWDAGVGREILAAEMMRAAARKHDLPLASYLVGGEAIRAEFFGYLMHGIKENGLYLYGPIGNIGPAWSDDTKALAETAATTRQVKPFEDLIAAATVRPSKAAILIATTSDIMQKSGVYFAPERQNLYLTLQHSGVPVEVVSEQDIVQDDILKNYSLLYVADPQVSSAAQQKIAAWVQSGGRLWAEAGAANWDEANQPSTALDAVFGVAKRSMLVQDGGFKPASAPWSANASKYGYQQAGVMHSASPLFGGNISVPVWGAKLDCTPTTAQVIGTYDDGKPATLLNRYGQGEALLVGALTGEAYVRLHYPDKLIKDWVPQEGWNFDLGSEARRLATGLVGAAKIEPPVTLSVPGVYTSVMETPGATLVFLNNATGRPLDKVSVHVRDVGHVRSLRSTRSAAVPYRMDKNGLNAEIPLANTEILCIMRATR